MTRNVQEVNLLLGDIQRFLRVLNHGSTNGPHSWLMCADGSGQVADRNDNLVVSWDDTDQLLAMLSLSDEEGDDDAV